MFRGVAEARWQEYARISDSLPRFPEWERAIMDMVALVGRREYIPNVSLHLTDRQTRQRYKVGAVYVLTKDVDYIFFYHDDDLVTIFFISSPLEARVSDAFNGPH